MSSPDVTKLYNVTDKTKFMTDKIVEVWCTCESSATIKADLRCNRDGSLSNFARSIQSIGTTLGIHWDRGRIQYVVKENVSADDMQTVQKQLKIAHHRFLQVHGHVRDLRDLHDIMPILHILDIISGRLADGQDWQLKRDAEGTWALYIMDETNTWRTEKNPVADAVEEIHENPFIGDPKYRNKKNPSAAQNAQLVSMLERVQHSMR